MPLVPLSSYVKAPTFRSRSGFPQPLFWLQLSHASHLAPDKGRFALTLGTVADGAGNAGTALLRPTLTGAGLLVGVPLGRTGGGLVTTTSCGTVGVGKSGNVISC